MTNHNPDSFESDAQVATPPPEIMASKHVIDESLLGNGARFNIPERFDYPPEGGIYIYYKGLPFPKKGFPFPDAVWMNDIVKRITVFFLRAGGSKDMALPALAFAILPYKIKLRTMERALYNFGRISLWMLQSAFLKDDRYSWPCRSMRRLIAVFLKEIGIGDRTAEDVAKVIATMFEYDDSYRYRFEDIMSETDRTKLITRPIREFRRLVKIFREREKFTDMFDKLDGFEAMGTLALMHPKIRKAFKKAVGSLNADAFEKMQLDDADKYHVLLRADYDFMGKSLESRMKRFNMVHTTSKCHNVHLLTNGFCSSCKMKCEFVFTPPPTMEIQK